MTAATGDLVAAVRTHTDTVLRHARDRWGPYRTPLLADGLYVDGREPVRWVQHGQVWTLSNLASQQNFLRVLVALDDLGAGDGRYRAAAHDVTDYGLQHVRLGGLMWWGGHCATDLNEKRLVFCVDGGGRPRHELKGSFPFYELMFRIDPAQARRVVESMWELHVRDWDSLSFNRHNLANLPPRAPVGSGSAGPAPVWDTPFTAGEVRSGDLTFMPSGADLAYAAAVLAAETGDAVPLAWARRLAGRYTGNPTGSGLPRYLFSSSGREHAHSRRPAREDRAAQQLGGQLGRDLGEHDVLTGGQVRDSLYCLTAWFEMTAVSGDPSFAASAAAALHALARHAFDPATATFSPVLTDGTRLAGTVLATDGYFGRAGTTLAPVRADLPALLALARAQAVAPDPHTWEVCRTLTARAGLGEFADDGRFTPGSARATSNPLAVFAVLALHAATGDPRLLDHAVTLGGAVVDRRLRVGLFVAPGRACTRIDTLEPLALLALVATLEGRPAPRWFGGRPRFHAHHDGLGRVTDSTAYYTADTPPGPLTAADGADSRW